MTSIIQKNKGNVANYQDIFASFKVAVDGLPRNASLVSVLFIGGLLNFINFINLVVRSVFAVLSDNAFRRSNVT